MSNNNEWYRTKDFLVVEDDGNFVTLKIHKDVYEMACVCDDVDYSTMHRVGSNIDLYPDSIESIERTDVPKGTLYTGTLDDCLTYPGTSHFYTVYVPAQYSEAQEVNLLIVLDGDWQQTINMKMNHVMDNMIADGEIPVTIKLCVNSGEWNDPEYVGPGYPLVTTYSTNDNRSIEFDRIDSVFSDFLLNELMPIALKGYNISKDPKKVLLTGNSSGAAAAFAAAYHRPDSFGNIWCSCSSFTNMRGGNLLANAIRLHDKRDFRVYISNAENDLNVIYGDLYTASWEVSKALEYKGYDFIMVINKAGHSDLYNCKELPDVLRWTWGDGSLKTRHTRIFTGTAFPIRY